MGGVWELGSAGRGGREDRGWEGGIMFGKGG